MGKKISFFYLEDNKEFTLAGQLVKLQSQLSPLLVRHRLLLRDRRELLTKGCFVDFSSTSVALHELFLKTTFEKESPRCYHDLQRVLKRARHQRNLKLKEIEILQLLGQSESKLIETRETTECLFRLKQEMTEMQRILQELMLVKDECVSHRDMYVSAANNAVILFKTITQMERLNNIYSFSLKWFLKSQQTSIENSNKCKVLEKRLRYIKDHLTYSLFRHVTNCTYKKDKLIFAFVLSCQLLISDGKLEEKVWTSCRNSGDRFARARATRSIRHCRGSAGQPGTSFAATKKSYRTLRVS